jgi:Flp pilus assembly pilin Flp
MNRGPKRLESKGEEVAMTWIEQGWVLGTARVQGRWDRGMDRLRGGVAGQSTVEYALVGALVVIAAAGALTMLGGELTSVFTNISKTLGAAAAGH